MEFGLNSYLGTYMEQGVDGVKKRKDSQIPEYLYKYQPLFIDNIAEDEKRLGALVNKQIWMASYRSLNDPYEFRGLSIDKELLNGMDMGFVNQTLDIFRDYIRISCFSSEINRNIPLWSHYTNNHSGFCVKYKINNPKYFYPVMYEDFRVEGTCIIKSLIESMIFDFENNLNEPSYQFGESFWFLYMSFACKFSFWRYEKEYRLIYNKGIYQEKPGQLIQLSSVDMEIDSIYIGIKCLDENRSRLIDIGTELSCSVYEMYIDDSNYEFMLNTKQII